MLLPPSLQEWLPEDHEIFISDAVEQLDLSAIFCNKRVSGYCVIKRCASV